MAKFGLAIGILLAAVEAGVSIGGIEARESVRHELLQTQVNPRAQVLQEFQDRIEKYMELHKKAKQQAPPLKESENPAEIKKAENALAASIRSSRAGAKQGDIFSPEIARLFRSLMYPETKGTQGAETKEAIREAQPDRAAFKLKVNARYPEAEPLPTVPPNLLANLPKLPEALEYRIVRNHLILRDVPANLIIDFIPNAIR
jgi:hypothetical protein